ncbi:YybH family protein [Variovorax sp. RT4R15]|uniref:YybH family protein n=1 Tax=Variovorax sp. RT4R15 TaxID=3443737 RepID=UPI003F45A00A
MTASSPEQEVWELELASWNHLRAGDLDAYMSLFHEDAVGWPNNQARPLDKSGLRELNARILSMIQSNAGAHELRQLSVHAFEGIVIAHFEVLGQAVTRTGQEFSVHERFTHTWMRNADGWKIIGGMSAPVVAKS